MLGDVINYIGVFATIISAVYSALTYHRPNSSAISRRSRVGRHWQLVATLILAIIAWAAAGFAYHQERLAISDSNRSKAIESWGVNPPNMFYVDVNPVAVHPYEHNFYMALVLKASRPVVDTMTDPGIVKSVSYTISDEPTELAVQCPRLLVPSGTSVATVRFTLIVMPQTIPLDAVRSLRDVRRLGGLMLASVSEGVPVSSEPPGPAGQNPP